MKGTFKMKVVILSVLAAIPLVLIARQPSAEEIAYYRARRYGAKVRECIRVVDQDGVPLAGVMVRGALQTGDGYNDYIPIDGRTDASGEYVIEGRCTGILRCELIRDGYYDSLYKVNNYGAGHSLKDGKWQPYGITTNIVMKKIMNPTAVGIRCPERKIPVFGEWIGYDLEKAEWTPPLGQGSCLGCHDPILGAGSRVA